MLKNPKLGQQCASFDIGRKNLIGSNSSVANSLLLLFKDGQLMRKKKCPRKITIILIQKVHPNYIALHGGKQGTPSTEGKALFPVFEKSETESKPNLLRCKNIVHIATFNVRTLNQLLELTASAVGHNLYNICM